MVIPLTGGQSERMGNQQMKECPNCHKQLPDLAKFCTSCGGQIELSQQEQEEAEAKMAALKAKLDSLSSDVNSPEPAPATDDAPKKSWDSFVIKKPTEEASDEPAPAEAEPNKVFSLEDRMKNKTPEDASPSPEPEPAKDETVRTLGPEPTPTGTKVDPSCLTQDEIEDMVQKKKQAMQDKMKSYDMDAFLDNMMAEACSKKKDEEEAAPADEPAAQPAAEEPAAEPAKEEPAAEPAAAEPEPEPAKEEPAAEPAAEEEKPPAGPPKLKPGRGYLIEEDKPKYVFKLFSQHTTQGMKGLCISRANPKRIAEDYDLENAQLLWLTDSTTATANVIPPSLERITYDIRTFIAANDEPIVLMDGLEYLMSNNKFNPVIRFLRHLVDECSESDCIMLIPISPMAISEQELKMIERELEVVEQKE